MNEPKRTLRRIPLAAAALAGTVAAGSGAAAPGTLADVPLFFSASTAPNILFLIDNSGSMNNVVPDTPYDASVTYVNCPSGQQLGTGSQVDIRITSGGNPYFRQSGTSYDWGTGSGTGATGRTKKCFNPTASYRARLYANASFASGTRYPSGYLEAVYTGNYLNWYFGCTGATASTCGITATNFGSGASIKPGQQRRMDIAKTAAKDLVNSLNNVRVGLAAYNGSTGAYIHVGIDDIAANKATMISKIDALTPSGSTPLGESLAHIGRYFVGESSPQYDGNLTLHPGQANQTTADDDAVFPDGPAYASGVSSSSPIQYFCQKSFAVLLTDGRPQSDRDTGIVSSYLRDYDGDCADPSKDDGHTPSATSCTSSTYDTKNAPHNYESYGSDWLDDVAKALYEMDLRPDLTDFSGNPVKNNVVTYAIGFADDQVINDPLLKDTARNGGGLFLTASNAASLKAAFESAVQSVLSQVGAAAAVAFNSGSITANSLLYLARFDSTRWSGDLIAYRINTDGSIGAQVWSAASQLDAVVPGSRVIITYDRDAQAGEPFRTLTDLSTLQQGDLSTAPGGGTDALGQARIDYLRGVRANEGTIFRTRTNRLGDIVHSAPVYVGAPALAWPDSAPFPTTPGQRYSDFKVAQAGRKPVVYVGANDGMLHGFDATDDPTMGGREVLAYVPHEVAQTIADRGLHYLTDPDYRHKYYVDLSPSASDVFYSGAWHTILVGGLRGGGRGLFALDVTDPATFSESNAANIVMWEFTDDDDADLGYTFSKPTVAMMNNGRFAVIVGNGYNNTGTGEAVLFILFVDGGLDGVWTSGTDYIKISTKVGTTTDPNGLATPAVADLDGDGTADRIYAGDLFGNMWVFDVSGSNEATWGSAYKTGPDPAPLFVAQDSTGVGQPITSKPFLLRNPDVATSASNDPNILVLFGTGQYLTDADKTTTDTQTFYAVWDSGTKNLTRTSLVQQSITEFSVTAGGTTKTVRVLTSNPVDYLAGNYGWYVDLLENGTVQQGERVVTSPVVIGDLVFFNTLIPDTTPCAYGGTGWLMSADASTGANPTEAAFDLNADGIVSSADLVTVSGSNVAAAGEKFGKGIPMESRFLADNQYTTSSEGTVVQRKISAPNVSNTGRLSWRQLCRASDSEC